MKTTTLPRRLAALALLGAALGATAGTAAADPHQTPVIEMSDAAAALATDVSPGDRVLCDSGTAREQIVDTITSPANGTGLFGPNRCDLTAVVLDNHSGTPDVVHYTRGASNALDARVISTR